MPRKKKIDEVGLSPVEATSAVDDKTRFTQGAEQVKEDIAKKPKRIRRTRAEIDAERNSLNDDGHELIASLLKLLSDMDVKRYGLDAVDIEFFIPLSQNCAKIVNYFMPHNKPIYMVAAFAVFQSITMLKTRADLINAKLKARSESNPNFGQEGNGQKFPSPEPINTV